MNGLLLKQSSGSLSSSPVESIVMVVLVKIVSRGLSYLRANVSDSDIVCFTFKLPSRSVPLV